MKVVFYLFIYSFSHLFGHPFPFPFHPAGNASVLIPKGNDYYALRTSPYRAFTLFVFYFSPLNPSYPYSASDVKKKNYKTPLGVRQCVALLCACPRPSIRSELPIAVRVQTRTPTEYRPPRGNKHKKHILFYRSKIINNYPKIIMPTDLPD